MSKKIKQGKWKKKKNRYFYVPVKGEVIKYSLGGTLQFFGVSKNLENKYRRLNKLEKKSRKNGLTDIEKKRFNVLKKIVDKKGYYYW